MVIDANKQDCEMTCHRDGHKHRLCKDLRDTCRLWIRIPRKSRQTGEDVEEYHCGDVWQVILAAEAIRETVGVHAALNSFRNEMVERNNEFILASLGLLPPKNLARLAHVQNNNNS